ncbi:MAG TPA: uroporphyrinogen decarboxylase family protein [Desulfosporosinus sp.]|nr:uroporphyrinogen decarboxylase family protein [Desulfosporosinus sp.]
MNSREIVTKAAQRQATPRVPVSLLSGGAWTFNRQGLSLQEALGIGAERAAELIASTNEQVGSDIVWAGSGYHNLALQAIGAKIKFRATGVPDIQEPLLQKASDVDGIDLKRLKNDDQLNVLWDTGRLLATNIGATTMIGGSSWGPFTLGGLAYGADHLLRNMYYDREAVHKILEFSVELCYQYLEPYIKGGAGIISIADPSASGNLISRKHFQEFSLPYLRKVIQRVRANGVLTLVHICGDISNRLDLITEIGADIISVDYKVDLGFTRATVGSVMAFAGNMDPVGVMLDLKPDEVARACQECLTKAGASGYILMPGCDIPPSVPLENIQAMVAVAHKFAKEVD